MKPAAKIIVRAPSGIPSWALWLTFAAGAGVVLWYLPGTPHETNRTTPVVVVATDSVIQSAQQPVSTVPASQSEISTAALRGEGSTALDWLKRIADSAPGRIQSCPESLVATLASFRICNYDGDAFLPIGEALDLLSYTGLSIAPVDASNGFKVHWRDDDSKGRNCGRQRDAVGVVIQLHRGA